MEHISEPIAEIVNGLPELVDNHLENLDNKLDFINEVSGTNVTKLTKENCITVINGLRQGMSYGEAAELIGAARETIWRWRKDYPQFNKLCEDAGEHGIDIVEAECRKRALAKSDLLMMFWLKAKRPDVYREGPTTQITNNITLKTLLVKSLEPIADMQKHKIIESE